MFIKVFLLSQDEFISLLENLKTRYLELETGSGSLYDYYEEQFNEILDTYDMDGMIVNLESDRYYEIYTSREFIDFIKENFSNFIEEVRFINLK